MYMYNDLVSIKYQITLPEPLADEMRTTAARLKIPLAQFIRPHDNDRDPDRRLRIGYVSPDFKEHPVGRLLVPLLANHDHANFETVCYSDVRCEDAITDRLRGFGDRWSDVSRLSDEQLAERIRQDRIDVLVDLTLHTAGNRLLVFARKPAPVQITWAGYPGTTGLETIDFRLSDPHLDPPGSNNGGWYSEKTLRLPNCFWAFDPQTPEPMVNELNRFVSVVQFSGVPTDSRRDGGQEKTVQASYSKSLRLAAARGGCDAIVCYWGILESARKGLASKPVSWVPIVGWAVPDEKQQMRIRIKVAVMDVRNKSFPDA